MNGNNYFIGRAAIVESYPLFEIPELAQQLQQHILENQTKLEMRDGFCELLLICNPGHDCPQSN